MGLTIVISSPSALELRRGRHPRGSRRLWIHREDGGVLWVMDRLGEVAPTEPRWRAWVTTEVTRKPLAKAETLTEILTSMAGTLPDEPWVLLHDLDEVEVAQAFAPLDFESVTIGGLTWTRHTGTLTGQDLLVPENGIDNFRGAVLLHRFDAVDDLYGQELWRLGDLYQIVAGEAGVVDRFASEPEALEALVSDLLFVSLEDGHLVPHWPDSDWSCDTDAHQGWWTAPHLCAPPPGCRGRGDHGLPS